MRSLSNQLLIGILSGCSLVLLPGASVFSQYQMGSHAPYAGGSTADPLADQAFQMQLRGTVSMPDFVVVDDRAVGEPSTAQSQATAGAVPNQLQPTLAKRPVNAKGQMPARPAGQPLARPQMKFQGPPIRPAKPFVGWNLGRSQAASRPRARTAMNPPAAVALVPQYMAYHAESAKTMAGGNGTSLARNSTPSNPGKFFSLNSKPAESVASASKRTCPNCGKRQGTQVANQRSSRLR